MPDLDNISSKEFLEKIYNFSNQKLKQKEDLERLIEISYNNNNFSLLEKTAFIAKYLQGLFNIIQRGDKIINEEIFARYSKEFSDNTELLKKHLKDLLKNSSDFYKKIFEEKYFSLTQVSISNLNELCFDLSWLKMYINENGTS
jgi:hypothetical protein